MGDSWRFDPNKDYLNDEDDGGFRRFKKHKNKKPNHNNYDEDDGFRNRNNKKNHRPNKNWR